MTGRIGPLTLDRHIIDRGDLQIFPIARAGSDDESRERFRGMVKELFVGNYGAVPVRPSGPENRTTVLAIHVIPAEWEWTPLSSTDIARGVSRARTMAKRCAVADPRWDWPA